MNLFDMDKVVDALLEFLGEDEKRRLIDECQGCIDNYRSELANCSNRLNGLLHQYNDYIPLINQKRRECFLPVLQKFVDFLEKFGDLGTVDWAFAFEWSHIEHRDFEREYKATDYKVDLMGRYANKDDEQIISEMFKKVIIGLKIENKKKNLEIKEFKQEIDLATDGMVQEYQLLGQQWETKVKIASLYLTCIDMIYSTIQEKILPELDLVLAFLIAENANNHIIADLPVDGTQKLDVTLLKGTIYDRHYRFLKNSFLFFTLSKRIYQSPILTRLVSNEVNTAVYCKDHAALQAQYSELKKQGGILDQERMGV